MVTSCVPGWIHSFPDDYGDLTGGPCWHNPDELDICEPWPVEMVPVSGIPFFRGRLERLRGAESED